MCLLYLWDPDDQIRGIRNSTPGVSGPWPEYRGVTRVVSTDRSAEHLHFVSIQSDFVGLFVNYNRSEHLTFR